MDKEILQFTETERHLLMKLDEMGVELAKAKDNEKNVKRANSKLKSALRKQRQENEKLKEKLNLVERKKTHYKNGKRGSKFNG